MKETRPKIKKELSDYCKLAGISERENNKVTNFYQTMKIEISYLSEKEIYQYSNHLNTNKKEVWVTLANKVLSITNINLDDKEELRLVSGDNWENPNELPIKRVIRITKSIFIDFYSNFCDKEE